MEILKSCLKYDIFLILISVALTVLICIAVPKNTKVQKVVFVIGLIFVCAPALFFTREAILITKDFNQEPQEIILHNCSISYDSNSFLDIIGWSSDSKLRSFTFRGYKYRDINSLRKYDKFKIFIAPNSKILIEIIPIDTDKQIER